MRRAEAQAFYGELTQHPLQGCHQEGQQQQQQPSRGQAASHQYRNQGVHKAHFPGVNAAALLDLPLEVKLPVIPGSNNLYYTTKLNKKLFQPSYGFNLTDPYCRLLDTQYNSLHDPHLRTYHSREDIRRRLRKGGYITRNNEVICSLKEFNQYRQYLTSLKLDFERHYFKEQEMLAKQINKFQVNNQLHRLSGAAQPQNWFLWEDVQSFKDQEPLIRPR
ncbi:fibrous sheath-interacting protein 2 [Pipistrellus kuhlii]|uniref:fibrous sheath-interacting protein 2 n=1 Tax=Pipistrellus kuhlii TaxID=59472 RepID=UPI001E271A1A|nr:fibrous sheath-interacting protein 2 [Pipistrellus kuhlii]